MVLYCSREIFEAVNGVRFPATKEDLLEYAEAKDAREAVIVTLDKLEETRIYRDISAVCENARIECSREVVRALADVRFPANREGLLEFAERHGAPASVTHALTALPSGYTFEDIEEMCRFIL